MPRVNDVGEEVCQPSWAADATNPAVLLRGQGTFPDGKPVHRNAEAAEGGKRQLPPRARGIGPGSSDHVSGAVGCNPPDPSPAPSSAQAGGP